MTQLFEGHGLVAATLGGHDPRLTNQPATIVEPLSPPHEHCSREPAMMGSMADHTTMAGHLAQTGYLTRHGEVLCTVGLTYLLDDPITRSAFHDLLQNKAPNCPLPSTLNWIAEARQPDSGRPDIEGRTADEVPVVKIEAKITAPLDPQQLASYAAALMGPDGGGGPRLLVILVPEARRHEATTLIGPLDAAPPHPVTAVVTWDEALDALAVTNDLNVAADVVQLRGMCTTLGALDIAPFDDTDLGHAWQHRRSDFEAIVARTTETLTGPDERILPLGLHEGYRRRYVCHPPGPNPTCYSVGVREPLPGTRTPIVMRYHRDTPGFAALAEALRTSELANELRDQQGDGHVWIPLEPTMHVGGARVVADLCDQIRQIDAVARGHDGR